MTKRTLADLAAAFSSKSSDGGGDQSWKAFFPFWKAEPDTTTIVRFLPDLDDNNPMGFVVENLTHTLFINGKRETVPCLKMYGESCPCCELSQKYYDEKSADHNEQLGKKYYRKKSYLGQVLVLESPLEFEAGKVYMIDFGPAIFKAIHAGFASGDLEATPYGLDEGHNFRIKKTKSGEYASYTTSSFSPKITGVDPEIVEKIELFNLADFRTERMSREQIEAMLVADQTGASTPAVESKPAMKAEAPAAQAVPAAQAAPAEASDGEAKMSVTDRLRARAAAAKAARGE